MPTSVIYVQHVDGPSFSVAGTAIDDRAPSYLSAVVTDPPRSGASR
jgi:hypothetical protein